PEEINSIALGDPSRIRAEHSEAEPRLVFLKPVASEAVHTNALITLKSGQAVNLNLLSMGKSARDPEVDFFIDSRRSPDPLVVSFSIVNHSPVAIELLPPQIELIGSASGKQSRSTKFEPVIISEYRMSVRRLGPGERADGVVLFDRPAFKESGERLELRIAQADQVDHPVVLPLIFTPQHSGDLR